MTNTLDELERLAKAATPGPWRSVIDDTGGQWSGWPLCIVPENDDDRSVVRTGGLWPYKWDAKVSQHEAVSTAAFIAAANPATIVAILSERAELLATVRRQGDLLEFMAAYIGTPAKERETQWPAWSATESKKEAVADYWAELASAAIIQTERERDKQLYQK